ncbi:hypothetical protein ACO1O0_005152 [Amphichorda felina]
MSLGISSLCRALVRPAGNAGLIAIPQNALRRRLQQPWPTLLSSSEPLRNASTSPSPSPLPEPKTTSREDKKQRNDFFRNAFSSPTDEEIEHNLSSPFVPPARHYPSKAVTAQSAEEARHVAKVQTGMDKLWSHFKSKDHFLASQLKWADTFALLQRATTQKTKSPRQMSAMRVVMPGNWDLEVSNQNIDFVDSSTGLQQKLRIYHDHRNPSAIIMRGTQGALAKAAEELLKGREGIQIFQLGKVDVCDYETKQLWPKIKEQNKSIPKSKSHSLWVHRERPEEHWIDMKYEDIPRPSSWTVEDFDSYIAKLVCGRLRPHLALTVYSEQAKEEGKALDTDGIRVKLIMDAFMDPEARPYITTPTLKMALAFMAQRGGHRASADRLFTLAEGWGLPMDTETFNIMLEGYVTKRDHRHFYLFLRKMRARYYPANARTWLLFLRLVEKDFEKRQIVAAMWELGLFKDPGLSRGIAGTMASLDAYTAFRSGKDLATFMNQQKGKHGDQWLSKDALHAILKEYYRFYGESKPNPSAAYGVLIEQFEQDGGRITIETVNVIIKNCFINKDWNGVLWALHLMEVHGCEADDITYECIIRLATDTSNPRALAAGFFYGALDRRLRSRSRYHLNQVFFGEHKNGFWKTNYVPIFTEEMAAAMRQVGFSRSTQAVSQAIRVVNAAAKDKVPTEPLASTLLSALLLDIELKKGGKAKPLEIGMRDKTESDGIDVSNGQYEPPTTIFHLDICFNPETMNPRRELRHRRYQTPYRRRDQAPNHSVVNVSPEPTTPPLEAPPLKVFLPKKTPAEHASSPDVSDETSMEDVFLERLRKARREM